MNKAERDALIRLRRQLRQVQMESEIVAKATAVVRKQKREDIHAISELMGARQADFLVKTMCRILGVSSSGFYDWQHRAPSKRAIADAVLSERIYTIHAKSRQTYGMPRIRAELADHGVHVRGKSIARSVRAAKLRGFSKCRAFTVITQHEPSQRPPTDWSTDGSRLITRTGLCGGHGLRAIWRGPFTASSCSTSGAAL